MQKKTSSSLKLRKMINSIISEETKLIKEEVDLKTVNWSPLFKEINKYLGTNLKFQIDSNEGGRRPRIISPNFVGETGIFKNILEEITVDLFNFGQTELGLWMTVSVNYSQRSGGSNGMKFLTAWYENGKWKFNNR